LPSGIGQFFPSLFGFLGLFGNPMLIFIALFLYLGESQEATVASLKDGSEWLSVSDAMVADFSVLSSESTVADAIEALLRTSQHEFSVVDGSGQVLVMLTRDDMIRALQTLGPDTHRSRWPAPRETWVAVCRRRSGPTAFRRSARSRRPFEVMQWIRTVSQKRCKRPCRLHSRWRHATAISRWMSNTC
jgi:hypothetical protein